MITPQEILKSKSHVFCVDMSNKSLLSGQWTSKFNFDFKPDFLFVRQITYNSNISDINTYVVKVDLEGVEDYFGTFINSTISNPNKYIDLRHMTGNEIKFNVCSPDMHEIDLLNVITPSFQNNTKTLTGNLVILVEFIELKKYFNPKLKI